MLQRHELVHEDDRAVVLIQGRPNAG